MYDLSVWQKIDQHLFDAGGGRLVHIRQPFMTSAPAILIGSVMSLPMLGYGIVQIVHGEDALALITANHIHVLFIPFGLWILISGIKGYSERQEHGGVHPKDTLLIFDTSAGELRRSVDGMEERVSALSDVTLTTKIERGKNTNYKILVHWQPDGKTTLSSTVSKSIHAKRLEEITNRTGLKETAMVQTPGTTWQT